jgi:transcription elongation factor GreA
MDETEDDTMAQYFLTEKGYLELKQEIARIDKMIKLEIAKEIATAADHGDLKENAEYAAAKEKQVYYANKLRALQERFTGANVVRRDELLPEGRVTFGKKIHIKEVNTGAERICTILGEGETDSEKGIIAYTSPLARALIGKSQGDVTEVQLPAGLRKYEILAVEFCEGFKE